LKTKVYQAIKAQKSAGLGKKSENTRISKSSLTGATRQSLKSYQEIEMTANTIWTIRKQDGSQK